MTDTLLTPRIVAALSGLAGYSASAPLTDPPSYMRGAVDLLAELGVAAAVGVTGEDGFIVTTTDDPDLPTAPPPNATLLPLEDQRQGWVWLRGTPSPLHDAMLGLLRSALSAGEAGRVRARRETVLDSLFTISSSAAAAPDLDFILSTIQQQTQALLNPDAFVVVLYDELHGELHVTHTYDGNVRQPDRVLPFDPATSTTAWMIANRQPVLIRDAERDELPVPQKIFNGERPLRSWIGVPMIAQDQVVGTLSLQAFAPDRFSPANLRLLSQIGQQAALAILTHRTRVAYQAQLDEQQALTTFSRELNARTAQLPVAELLSMVRDFLGQSINVDTFYVAIYDAATRMISFPLVVEQNTPSSIPTRRADNGMTEYLIRTGEPLLLVGNLAGELESRKIDRIGSPPHAWMGVPLWIGGEVVGAMVVQTEDESVTFDELQLRLMTTVAGQAAGAMQLSWLLAEEQQQRARLEESHRHQAALLEVIRELSTPVVPIVEGVVALPLVGSIDSQRANQILSDLLASVSGQRAQVVLLDITGVPIVDTSVANYLLHAIKATQLLGARCALVGIRPEVAQTIVGLGVNLSGVETLASLQEGVLYALRVLGRKIVPIGPERSAATPARNLAPKIG